MKYFTILDLKREPFSNSPEPDFFYLSENHWGCLQKLELAIRVKRGLNVVLGEVGTGKTTLCRQLLIKLAKFNEQVDQFETQLILDPDFSTPREFLQTVAQGFGIAFGEETETEWHLKERIKNFLFQKGLEEGKIIVLIIDEGQKLPPFCLEKLREFLNYETNEFKLLQIVIFAQKEFQKLLEDHSNFADRINQLLYLDPLSFRETKNLINHRLAVAAAGETIPSFFNLRAYWTIWLKSRGYPRRIITLCHQIMLAMIVSNQKKAAPSIIKASAAHLPVRKTRKFPLIPVAITGFLFALILAGYSLGFNYQYLREYLSGLTGSKSPVATVTAPQPESLLSPTITNVTAPKAETAVSAISPGIAGNSAPEAAATTQQAKEMPKILGQVTISRHSTLSEVIQQIYGVYTKRRLQTLAEHNPLITDVNAVRSGMKIIIPAIISETAPPRDKPYLVEVTSNNNLDEAYSQLLKLPDNVPPLRLFAYWSSNRGVVFALHMKETFYDELSASKSIERLPRQLSARSRVIDKWDSDTVFYTDF